MSHRRGHEARPLLIVCSTGGHLLQMQELREAWEPFERVWVTFDKSDSRSLLRDERVVHAFGPTNRNIPNLLRNLRLAFTRAARASGRRRSSPPAPAWPCRSPGSASCSASPRSTSRASRGSRGSRSAAA